MRKGILFILDYIQINLRKRNGAKQIKTKKESHFHPANTHSLSGRLVLCSVVDILSLCELACYSIYAGLDGFSFLSSYYLFVVRSLFIGFSLKS